MTTSRDLVIDLKRCELWSVTVMDISHTSQAHLRTVLWFLREALRCALLRICDFRKRDTEERYRTQLVVKFEVSIDRLLTIFVYSLNPDAVVCRYRQRAWKHGLNTQRKLVTGNC
jgi:hypothetical protein